MESLRERDAVEPRLVLALLAMLMAGSAREIEETHKKVAAVRE